MAKVIPIGQPVNQSERDAIAALRHSLPDHYTLLHNLELQRQGEHFEIDLALLTPHALYLIDVKGLHGAIDVHGARWYPQGSAPSPSPLLKLRSHARTVKGLITQIHPGRRDLDDVYVDAVILLTAPDAFLNDPGQHDADSVVRLKEASRFFQDSTRIPVRFSRSIQPLHNLILRALSVAKPPAGPLRFRHWEVKEKLGGTAHYTEYRAENQFAGGTARLRVYSADPYLPPEVRRSQLDRIANAYKALSRLPTHPNIVAVRDFFPLEDETAFVLVLEDAPGQALTLHLTRPQLALTLDQKWQLTRELLSALTHAHRHGVLHRNLTPGALLVGIDGVTHLTDFDFAKPEINRSRTIAADIIDLIEPAYVAPEAYREPGAATAASDIFSAGLILYELFTGEKPFGGDPAALWDHNGVFPTSPSALRPELDAYFDRWLQSLCAFDEHQRPTAEVAWETLRAMARPIASESTPTLESPSQPPPSSTLSGEEIDLRNLPTRYALTHKYVIEKKLGEGNFGVVYKVIDTLGDVTRTVKLIDNDRHSTLDRLRREYASLVRIPAHPHVVQVLDADLIPGRNIPYLVFEYVDGTDVAEMIKNRLLSPEDALELGKQVLDGLVYVHGHGVHHCDIKPSNLLWTRRGAKIIDFNVAVRSDDPNTRGGGSYRYLPPDFDREAIPQNGERADRDLYALGLTLYEALTGHYPWDTAQPPLETPAPDPRQWPGCEDLSQDLVNVLLKAIAPRRAQRFASTQVFSDALAEVRNARRLQPVSLTSWSGTATSASRLQTLAAPNTNPFLSYLLSLYSQSHLSNAGTRGMDALGFAAYVDTALDRELLPAVLQGEFRLVLISGNAGDGKTAFLQRLENEVAARGGQVDRGLPNGSALRLDSRHFLLNYDGSQDEGAKDNDQVLREFLSPFAGDDSGAWRVEETRLIAINEGRLIDFLAAHAREFPALTGRVQQALRTGACTTDVAVVNLNLRSVVARADGGSILERTLRALIKPEHWAACELCDLKGRCYALHNARSFQDETAGPQLLDRLRTLYTLVHLRGRLHITMRDLRSALSFMLTSNRDCADIHALYATGHPQVIAGSYYFNSWMGGDPPPADRLIRQLRDLDVGFQEDPRFDRGLDFIQPDDRALFRFARRGRYDFEVLKRLFTDLPRGVSEATARERAVSHQTYVAMARRKHFFERRDGGWERMLPYRWAKRLVDTVCGSSPPETLRAEILHAVNRGEGLLRPERLGGSLALQLRQVEHGTVRSYRLFPVEEFTLVVQDHAVQARFVEHLPTGLTLSYAASKGSPSTTLAINLDVFEMLMRLNDGYRPSVEELQGFYLCLAVFKNGLNAQSYREMLLTTTGHDFFRLTQHEDGKIELRLEGPTRTPHNAPLEERL